MYRIILMVVKLLYMVPYWFYMLYKLGRDDSIPEDVKYRFLRKMVKKINKAGRVVIQGEGQEKLPQENGYVIFPNHQGLFDVLAIADALDRPFSVVIKKEARNVILLKQVVTLLKGLSIDREDIRQSMKVILQVTKEVKEGRNYLIFAEGTRSTRGNEILEFKSGTFKSAMNAKCPIVPMALIDSFQPFDRNSIHKVTVQVHVLDPIPYEEYQGMKSHEIAIMVSDLIRNKIQEVTSGDIAVDK